MKKKLILSAILCMMLMIMVGCSAFEVPENIYIEDGVIYWNSVEGATGYNIYVDGKEKDYIGGKNNNSPTNSYDLTQLDLIEGNIYKICIRAVGDGYIKKGSDLSAEVEYVAIVAKKKDDKNELNTESKIEDVTDTNLSETLFESGLGYGVNALTAKSAVGNVRLASVFDETAFTNANIGSYKIGSSRSVATSKENISDELIAINSKLVFGVSGQAGLDGMFTAGFEEKFSLSSAVEQQNHVHQFYFIMNQYVAGSNYQMKNYVQKRQYQDKLSQGLLLDLDLIREKKLSIDEFFNMYGTHLSMAVTYGGMVEVYYAMFSKHEINAVSIKADLESKVSAGISIPGASASTSSNFGASLDVKYTTNETDITKKLYIASVGKNPLASLTFDSFATHYPSWVDSMKSDSNYRIVDVADNGLVPIWYYFPDNYSDVSKTISDYFYAEASEHGNSLAKKMQPIEDKGDTTNFAGGKGTDVSPYLITTKEHFIYMVRNCNSIYYYKLNCDIDLGDWSNYGINNWSKESRNPPTYFTGTFDGNNKVITYCIRIGKTTLISWALGLFPTTKNATIKNLKANVDIRTYDPQNRNQKWDIPNGDRAQDVMVGGIVGYAKQTNIKDCSSYGTIRYNSDGGSGDTCVAGIVGYALSCESITNCSSSATIYARGCWISIAGIIACCYKTTFGALSSTANLSSNEDWAFTGGTSKNDTVAQANKEILSQD